MFVKGAHGIQKIQPFCLGLHVPKTPEYFKKRKLRIDTATVMKLSTRELFQIPDHPSGHMNSHSHNSYSFKTESFLLWNPALNEIYFFRYKLNNIR